MSLIAFSVTVNGSSKQAQPNQICYLSTFLMRSPGALHEPCAVGGAYLVMINLACEATVVKGMLRWLHTTTSLQAHRTVFA